MRFNRPAFCLVLIACFAFAHIAHADDNSSFVQTVTVQKQNLTLHYAAYATVRPVAVVHVRAGAGGTVAELKVVPGDHVRAGETLATLGGAQMKAEMAQATAAAKTAQARADAAKRLLAIAKKTLSDRLGTRQTFTRAENELAAAEAAHDAAQAKLQALQDMAEIKAPVDGVILARSMADGERVSAGENILTLRPDDSLWLTAEFYGADTNEIHAGMHGVFAPATGGASQPVIVRSVYAALAADGGETVGMTPVSKGVPLQDGSYGQVTLDGTAQKMVAVPTRALILDRGQWWVLVQTDKGLQKRNVTPGPARGWMTFVKNGLDAGDAVVTDDAYALFHRGIASSYQPPD